MTTTANLVKCGACGRDVSSDARVCIHCGHPLKRRNLRTILGSLFGPIIVIAVCYLVWANFFVAIEGGLPDCTSTAGQSEAKKAIENSPFGKATGIEIVAITDAQTQLSTDQKVECNATAILNNTMQAALDYSFEFTTGLPKGQYFVRAAINPESMHALPASTPSHDLGAGD
jgi:hypothetical protein